MVLFGNTQPGVPDHISHLERGKLEIKTCSEYTSTSWGRKKKERSRRKEKKQHENSQLNFLELRLPRPGGKETVLRTKVGPGEETNDFEALQM